MSSRGHLLLRLSASIVALTFLFALVGAHLHQATIQHGYCSEHGEVIHLDRAQAAAVSVDRSQQSRIKSDVHLQGAHDCLSLAFLTHGAAVELDAPLAPGLMGRSPGVAPPLARATAAIALLHLSPKNSPPGC